MLHLNKKNILVSGASSGIGRRSAILASNVGANVILIGRNTERLKETYEKLGFGNHLYYTQDITKYNKIEELIRDSVSKIGKISGFIHSAGIEATVPLRSMNTETYETLYSVNVISAFEIVRILTKKKYYDSSGTSIVFISSIMGLVGQKGKVGYCSSKSALIGGTKAMALELAPKNIRVNCILPGIIQTDMTNKMFEILPESSKKEIIKAHPLGLGRPEDVATACLFLLSDLSKWITGTNLIIDGGYSAK